MSDTSNKNPKPPFRGFTEIFRRVNDPKEESAQTPLSKNVDPLAYEPAHRRPSSHKSQTFEHVAKQVVQNEKSPPPPPPPPPIIVPPLVTYEEWFADRINQAVARCRQIYGPIDDKYGQPVDEDVRRLANKIKRCISDGRTPSTHEQSCQCADCRTSANDRGEIYDGRNVNSYPQKYKFDLLNNRLRKMITNKSDSRWLREFVRRSILRDSVLSERDQPVEYDRYGAERHELTELVNRRLRCPPSKRISFRPENLAEWRARFAFKVDKKYKYIPKVATFADEGLSGWLGRARGLLDRQKNKDAIKSLPDKVEAGEVDFVEESASLETSLKGRKPSLSHCRSEFYYNGRLF